MNSQPVTRNTKLWQRIDYGLLLALVLPLFAIMPLLTHAGLPNTADGPAHLMRQVELNQAWQQGNFYPRWGTDLALGHGMPIFSYAPPALYHLTQLFHLSGLPLDESMKAVLVFDFLLYSLGMFLFARRIYGPAPALVAAAVYVYAPYRLREAYIQGNYGQFTGLAFYPLVLWAFHGLITDGRLRYWVAAPLALAGLLFSHNISFMVFAPLLAAYLIFLLVLAAWTNLKNGESANKRVSESVTLLSPLSSLLSSLSSRLFSLSSVLPPLFRTMCGGLLGLGLAAIFWLPAFGERHDIKLEGITQTFFDFRENFISLSELLSPPFPLDLTAINPYFPLSLGLPQIMGAVLAMVGMALVVVKWGKRRRSEVACQRVSESGNQREEETKYNNPRTTHLTHTLFFIAALLLYIFLALPASQTLWESIPLLELAEFPWRMLGPAIFCASILGGAAYWLFTYALPASSPSPRALAISLLATFVAIIALNAHYLYPSQFISWGTPSPADAFAYEVQSGAIGTTSTGEFLPSAAQQHPLPQTLWPDYEAGGPPQKIDPDSLPAGATVETLYHLAESDAWRVNTPEMFVATIRTLYWPGWQLYLNGEPANFTVTEGTGLIQTIIPAGQHTLTLQLESTPLRSAGRWLTVISTLVLIILAGMAIKKEGSVIPGMSWWPSSTSPHKRENRSTSPPLRGIERGPSTKPGIAEGRSPTRPEPVERACPEPVERACPEPVERACPEPVERVGRQWPVVISPGIFIVSLAGLLLFYLLSRPLSPLFVLQSNPNRPRPAAHIVQADFAGQLRLVGFDGVPETVEPGDTLPVVVYWRALSDLSTNYSVFLHLDTPTGQTVATIDEVDPEYIPTRNWPPTMYLRNLLKLDIPAGIPPIRYDLTVGVYNRATGERLPLPNGSTTSFSIGSVWLVTPDPSLPAASLAQFGPNITLRHVEFAGESVVLYWKTTEPLAQNYSIFIHLLNADGDILAQADGVPFNGAYPLPNWRPGQVVVDERLVVPLLDNPAQLSAISLGVYNPPTGERLAVTGADGRPQPNNSLVLPVRR